MSGASGAGTGERPLLELRDVGARFGELTILRDVTLEVPVGSAVALLGPNGAGKTTLLKLAAGLLRPASGTVRLDGEDVTRSPANARARGGLCLVPEGRGIFRNLTVKENLRLQVPRSTRDASYDAALEAFPVLKERLSQTAGTMSGGQQQMLALARSFVSEPRVVLLDEVSMGLAPRVVDQIFEALTQLASRGTALLIVEQYVGRALSMADEVYLLDRGRITFHGPAAALDEEAVAKHYLGDAGSHELTQRSARSEGMP